jgi:hypothetical protein
MASARHTAVRRTKSGSRCPRAEGGGGGWGVDSTGTISQTSPRPSSGSLPLSRASAIARSSGVVGVRSVKLRNRRGSRFVAGRSLATWPAVVDHFPFTWAGTSMDTHRSTAMDVTNGWPCIVFGPPSLTFAALTASARQPSRRAPWLASRSCERSERLAKAGGERGIRTLGRVSPTHAFQACSFNHSDISPHE